MGACIPTRRLLVGLAVTFLLAGCATSASPTPVPASPTPVVTPSTAVTTPAPTPPAAQSPAAVTDQALMNDLAALWSTAYDAAKVAALYAPNAVFHDNIVNETSTGLEEIQAKVKEYAALGFKVTNTSAPIRQDNFVAVFQRFGAGEATSPGLGVSELKDGKVLNQWVYPAASSPAAQSPAAVTDQALMNDLAALWSTAYDAAKVAALYAPNAVFRELTDANETSTGLEEIGARIRYFNAQDFKVVVTSAPIRQDNFVANFVKFGGGEAAFPGLVVYELKDGKVLNQWVYPAP